MFVYVRMYVYIYVEKLHHCLIISMHICIYHQEIYKHRLDLINTVIPGGARKGQCFIKAKGNITGM